MQKEMDVRAMRRSREAAGSVSRTRPQGQGPALYSATFELPCRIAASIAEKAAASESSPQTQAMRPKRPGVARFKLVGGNTQSSTLILASNSLITNKYQRGCTPCPLQELQKNDA
jgi:hypothetical protein